MRRSAAESSAKLARRFVSKPPATASPVINTSAKSVSNNSFVTPSFKTAAVQRSKPVINEAVEYLGQARNVNELERILEKVHPNQPQIALVARSNAGKSSLVNSLLGTKLAIVSKVPGRTRLAHAYQAHGFILIDLPGYGYAQGADSKEATAMSDVVADIALERGETNLVLQLIDARRGGFLESDAQMDKALKGFKVPHEQVFTKIDSLNVQQDEAIRKAFPTAFFVSSRKNWGILELKKYLQRLGKR